jgi:hypothetical protein
MHRAGVLARPTRDDRGRRMIVGVAPVAVMMMLTLRRRFLCGPVSTGVCPVRMMLVLHDSVQSDRDSSAALPPVAAVLIVRTRSAAKRCR